MSPLVLGLAFQYDHFSQSAPGMEAAAYKDIPAPSSTQGLTVEGLNVLPSSASYCRFYFPDDDVSTPLLGDPELAQIVSEAHKFAKSADIDFGLLVANAAQALLNAQETEGPEYSEDILRMIIEDDTKLLGDMS